MKRIFVLFFTLMLSAMSFAQDDEMGKVKIHGFVSQGYMQSSANNFYGNTKDGTFEFNEIGLNFSTTLMENLRIGVQIFARDLGFLGNDELTVDWAYGDYSVNNWLSFRAGKMKMPLGLYNEYRDLDMARVNIFMPQGMYSEIWRDSYYAIKGIGVNGSFGVGTVGSLNYNVQAGALTINEKTGLNKFIEDQLHLALNNYEIKTSFAGSLQWETPLPGFKLGASFLATGTNMQGHTEESDLWKSKTVDLIRGIGYQSGINPAELPPVYQSHKDYVYAKGWILARQELQFAIDLVNTPVTQTFENVLATWFSAEYINGDLTLAAEYYELGVDMLTTLTEYTAYGVKNETLDHKLGSYYGSAAYRFSELFEIGTYYSEYYTNLDDKDGKKSEEEYGFPASNSYLKDFALSLRFDLNPYWIFKLEGHSLNGTAVMFRRDQDNQHDVEKDWFLFAGKLTFNF